MANSSVNLSDMNLESMEGQTWSIFNKCFEDSNSPGNLIENDVQRPSKKLTTNGVINKSSRSDTMKLKQEDMYLYGHCPAWEQFYLVVCEYCGKVIKPQALSKHIELRHKATSQNTNSETLNKRSEPSSSSTNNNHCVQNNRNTNQNKINCTAKASSLLSSSSSSSSTSSTTSTFLENSSNKNSAKIKIIPTPPGPGPGGGSTDTKNGSNKKSTFNNSAQVKNSSSSKTSSPSTSITSSIKNIYQKEKILPCKDREYDANKHCGVRISDSEKPCTRSLTCKTHSLTLRRSVNGRCKNFDQLLIEHKAAKEAKLKALGIKPKLTKQQIRQKEQEAKKLLQKQKLDEQQQSKQITQEQQSNQKDKILQNKQKLVNHNNQQAQQQQQPQQIHLKNDKNSDDFREPVINIQRLKTNIKEERKEYFEKDTNSPIFAKDGSVYLPLHPKPQALCTFNGRYLNFGPQEITFISFDRKQQFLLSSFEKFFKKNSSVTQNTNKRNLNVTNNKSSNFYSSSSNSSLLNSPAQPTKKFKSDYENSNINSTDNHLNINNYNNTNNNNRGKQSLSNNSSLLTSNNTLSGSTSLLSQSYVKMKSFKKKSKLNSLNNGDVDCLSPSSSRSSLSSPPTPINKNTLHKVSASTSSLISSQTTNIVSNDLLNPQPTDSISKSILMNGYHYGNNSFQSKKGSTRTNSTNNPLLRLPSSLSFTSASPSSSSSSSPSHLTTSPQIAATMTSNSFSNAQQIQQLQSRSVLKSKQHSKLTVATKSGSIKFLQN